MLDNRRVFALTLDDLKHINPNTKFCPIYRTTTDALISSKIHKNVPVFWNHAAHHNPWDAQIQRMFSLTDANRAYETATTLKAMGAARAEGCWMSGDAQYLPLYSGKYIYQFSHRYATAEADGVRAVRDEELRKPEFTIATEYWVARDEVARLLSGKTTRRWLLCFRNVTNATNERTTIAAVVPWSGTETTCRNIYLGIQRFDLVACLLGNLNAIPLDYVARQKTGATHLASAIAYQLPVVPPNAYEAAHVKYIVPRVMELTYTSWDLQSFARDCGYDGPPFKWDEARRSVLRCELDAAYFHLYGIERADVDYIMDTFPIVKRKDEQKHKEYRTKRVILDVYDAMAQAMATGEAYETQVDPVPAHPRLSHPPVLPQDMRVAYPDPGKYLTQFVLSMLQRHSGSVDYRVLADASALLATPHILNEQVTAVFDTMGSKWLRGFNEKIEASLFRHVLLDLAHRGIVRFSVTEDEITVILEKPEGIPYVPWVSFDVSMLLGVLYSVPDTVLAQIPDLFPRQELLTAMAG
jgi:hypothetical protein